MKKSTTLNHANSEIEGMVYLDTSEDEIDFHLETMDFNCAVDISILGSIVDITTKESTQYRCILARISIKQAEQLSSKLQEFIDASKLVSLVICNLPTTCWLSNDCNGEMKHSLIESFCNKCGKISAFEHHD